MAKARRNKSKTPTAILAMRGSWRATSREKTEPTPPTGTPVKPDWISSANVPSEQAIWDHVVDDLDQIGTLAQTDGRTIARYCVVLHYWLRAKSYIDRHGETIAVHDDDGNVIKSVHRPEAQTFRHLLPELLRIEREFGLTPSSRAGLTVAPKKSEEDIEKRYFG